MKILRLLPITLFFLGCQDHSPCADCGSCGKNLNATEETLSEAIERSNTTESINDDFIESERKIKAQYGEQWDFCDCVVKGDSLNKAIAAGELSDEEYYRISKRFDEIELKCKVFKIQDPSRTPEERMKHEKRVKQCLENYDDK